MRTFDSTRSTWESARFRFGVTPPLTVGIHALRLPEQPPAGTSADASLIFALGVGECYLLSAAERWELAWCVRFLERARAGDAQGLAMFRRCFFRPGRAAAARSTAADPPTLGASGDGTGAIGQPLNPARSCLGTAGKVVP